MNTSMSFDSNNPEEELLDRLSPYLKEICHNRWHNLEPEDRLSEAFYIATQAIRYYPVNSGHFLEDLNKALCAHLDELNRKEPSRLYNRMYSLDRQIPASGYNSFWTLYDVIADDNQIDDISIINMFINSLPKMEAAIITDLYLYELPKAAIARKYRVSIYKLNKYVKSIWEKYQSET